MNKQQQLTMKINTQNTMQQIKNQRKAKEITIENVLKSKFAVYMQNKHLIQQLFTIQQSQILAPFQYLWKAGGKKVRVIAALLIQDLFHHHKYNQEIIKIGGLIDLLHCASLIIDDIQDGSIQRRGQPCSHSVYGVDSSINAANLIYFLPAQKLFSSLNNLQLRCKTSEIYMKSMIQCHVGQGLDIKYHKIEKKQELPSTEEYIKLTSLKTGGLMKMLVKMVGAVMQITNESINLLTECMTNVGIAFQIIDDVLNVLDNDCLGKGVVAQDLRQKKFTLIVDMLRQNQEFMHLFFVKEKSQLQILRLLQIIRQSGVLQKCRDKAKQYGDKAFSCIEKLECPGDKQAFKLFIKFITQRKN